MERSDSRDRIAIYCLKCKTKTYTCEIKQIKSKNNRLMLQGKCVLCGTTKSRFISAKEGKGLADKLINKMPEMHLPFHNYTGPFTKLNKKLDSSDKPKQGYEPYNQVDKISMLHDICYRDTPKFKDKNKICDKEMLKNLREMKPIGIREWIDKKFVQGVIGAKKISGLGNYNI